VPVSPEYGSLNRGRTRRFPEAAFYKPPSTTGRARYINVQVELEFPPLPQSFESHFGCTFKNDQTGKWLGGSKPNNNLEILGAGRTVAWFHTRVGAEHGAWIPGTYSVNCYLNQQRIATASFTVR
jgi:hypothetical protein